MRTMRPMASLQPLRRCATAPRPRCAPALPFRRSLSTSLRALTAAPSSTLIQNTHHKLDTPNPLPAMFMRGGTSKGIFINRKYLPEDQSHWDPILKGIMGSPDPIGRQLNGMGGGISSLSKICVVGRPAGGEPVDVEYTFIQIGIKDGCVDVSGNCGNLSAAIGVFALDEGICRVPSTSALETLSEAATDGDRGANGRRRVVLKMLNTNTGKTLRTTFPVNVRTGLAELSDAEIETAGVPGKHSRILLEVTDPAGARTGKLLPTGRATDAVRLDGGGRIKISCIDAANPTVFLMLSKLNSLLCHRDIPTLPTDPDEFVKAEFSQDVLDVLEDIRRQAATMMGLDPNTQAQPKISILRPSDDPRAPYDFAVKTLSMGILHKAIPSTVALCIAAATGVRGSVVNQAYSSIVTSCQNMSGEPMHESKVNWRDFTVRLAIPGGVVGVNGRFGEDGEVKGVAMERTARRLMRGEVYW